MQQIQITVQENDRVAATFFPANSEKKLNRSVIVGPAAAVSQTYYTGFCQYLAEAGSAYWLLDAILCPLSGEVRN